MATLSIPTTHVGSLPRSHELAEMLLALDHHQDVDLQAFDTLVQNEINDAARPEYEAIVDAGFDLQLDCPDLAMSRHTGYQNLSEAEFLRIAAANVEALNEATANIPPERLRMHICWGNYEGPHDHDIPLENVLDIILRARPGTWTLQNLPCKQRYGLRPATIICHSDKLF